MVQGRCMKCKKPVEIKDGKEVTMKNGMKAMKGTIPKSGTKKTEKKNQKKEKAYAFSRILKTFVPHFGHVPFMAFMPFFIVTSLPSLI